jgi:N utilization substance protein B
MSHRPTTPAADDPTALQYLRRRRFARACALRYLYQADLAERWELLPEAEASFWEQTATLDDSLEEPELSSAQEFARKLIQGVIAKREAIDACISGAADNWTLSRMAVVDRNLLRIAVFEIQFAGSDVPPVAAMNEAIELAKEYGDQNSPRFINGVLDHILKAR